MSLGTIKSFDVAGKQEEPLASFKNELGVRYRVAARRPMASCQVRPKRAELRALANRPDFSQPGGKSSPSPAIRTSYDTLTLSADGKTAATVQVRTTSSLSLLPGAGAQGNTTVQPLTQAQDVQSVAWTADGKLLVSDGQSVRTMNPDGGQRSTILNDPNSWIADIARCGDRYIVLAWAFHGGTNQVHIWRTNADGSNPKQLTNGVFDRYPVCSPDGKWLYYYDAAGPHFSMRVPLEGGQPEPVPASDVHGMYGFGAGEAISPDGKRLIFNADINAPENSASGREQIGAGNPGLKLRSPLPSCSNPIHG